MEMQIDCVLITRVSQITYVDAQKLNYLIIYFD